MREHVIPGIIAAAVASAISAGAGYYAAKHPTATVVHVVADKSISDHAAQRRAAATWPEIAQRQVDALTTELNSRSIASAKKPVAIYCKDDRLCGDLALNFENSLESAHWKVDREEPLFVTTKGLSTSSPELSAVISRATGLVVATHQGHSPDKIELVIGTKQ